MTSRQQLSRSDCAWFQTLETASALHAAEGLALVMLCQCRVPPRRVSALILKEVKLLLKALGMILIFALDFPFLNPLFFYESIISTFRSESVSVEATIYFSFRIVA